MLEVMVQSKAMISFQVMDIVGMRGKTYYLPDHVGFYSTKINKLGHTDKTSDEAIYGPLAHTILSGVLCYGLADKIYI